MDEFDLANYMDCSNTDCEYIDTDSPIDEYLDKNGYSLDSSEIVIDYLYFKKNYPAVADRIRDEPKSVIDHVQNHIRKKRKVHVPVRIINFNEKSTPIRFIRDSYVGKLINTECIVKKVSDIKQEMVFFGGHCAICGTPLPLYEVDERVLRPIEIKCPIESKHRGVVRDNDRCIFRDIQSIIVQERQAECGRQPKSIMGIISSGIVDKVQAGNRVKLTAYIRRAIDGNKKNLAYTYLEVVNIGLDGDDFSEVNLTEGDICEMHDFVESHDIYKAFSESICPSIYGYENVKLGLVFSMFGGVTKVTNGHRTRGESHILLCGDPSTAKSQLIYSVSQILPRAIYTSGRSTSGCGLTATMERDNLDGRWTVEAGALPLANGSAVICDEFDKLSDEDRSALHEAMEQGSISINKASVSEKFETQTTIIAAANPMQSRFQQDIDYQQQIDLPWSLISRFDLVFVILDVSDNDTDRAVAKSILKARYTNQKEESKHLSIEFMRKYITYAKSINPVASDEVMDKMIDTYTSLRKQSKRYITHRQISSLARLAEASARVRLSETVDDTDARRAVSIYLASLESTTVKTKMSVEDFILVQVGKDGEDTFNVLQAVVERYEMDLSEANSYLIKLIDEGKLTSSRVGNTNRIYPK